MTASLTGEDAYTGGGRKGECQMEDAIPSEQSLPMFTEVNQQMRYNRQVLTSLRWGKR